MKNPRILAVLAACLLVASMAGAAVGQVANVEGMVYDFDTDDPIGNAHFGIQNTDTNDYYNFDADGGGHFSFYLPEGNYHSECTADGYESLQNDFYFNGMYHYTNIYMNSTGGSDNNNDDNDGEDSGIDDPNMDDFMPLDMDEETLKMVMTVVVSLIVVFLICFITITITLVAMFVRLGKIKKELKALNESMKPRAPPQAPIPPQYQQPPPPPPTQ